MTKHKSTLFFLFFICSLIFDDQVQIKLLEYVYTTFLFSDKNVNPDLVSWNR